MAKFANDDVLDALLDEIAEGNVLTVCSDQPTTRTEAITTYKLASVALTPGDGNGDFAIANGDISGRKVTITQQDDIAVDDDGEATHVAICDGTRLLYVTTCTPQVLTQGNTITVQTWKAEVSDPT